MHGALGRELGGRLQFQEGEAPHPVGGHRQLLTFFLCDSLPLSSLLPLVEGGLFKTSLGLLPTSPSVFFSSLFREQERSHQGLGV